MRKSEEYKCTETYTSAESMGYTLFALLLLATVG